MKLSELLINAFGSVGENIPDVEISDVQSDSRKVGAGSLFVAVKGTAVDGHAFIDKAIEQGAAAIVCEHFGDIYEIDDSTCDRERLSTFAEKVNIINVPDSALALGLLASGWYGNPSRRMKVVGVTGTNGKTTIATLLYDIFRRLGYKAGLLSTVCNYIDGKPSPTEHTTPDPLTIHRLMAEMVDAGCEYAFMEVSSHAIDQKRIAGIDFDGGIFTNLTRDHLDYHGTVDNYLKAKKTFFDELPDKAFALTNIDDKTGEVMLQNTMAKRLTYSLRTAADFKSKIIETHLDGTEMIINNQDVFTHFAGRFNTYNLLAVYGATVALGEDSNEALIALSALHPVAGRFETIHTPKGVTAIVDYAHTPDALINVLDTINEIEGTNDSRIITVVGAGGNRDKGKRPLMAQEAAKRSTRLILTSDNPRFEEPEAILDDMVAGLNEEERKTMFRITDRKEAIKLALTLAQKGDVVLIAGKGHEDYQDVKGVKHHFDDKETVINLENQLNVI